MVETMLDRERTVVPGLNEDGRNALFDLCGTIAAAACRLPADSPGLAASDRAAIAQYLHAWQRVTGDVQFAVASGDLFEATCAQIGAVHLPPHWIGGLSGVVHALSRLARASGTADESFSEEFDQALLGMLSSAEWQADYDVIIGLAGYGLYAIEHPDPSCADQLTGHVLRHLAARGRRSGARLSWHTPPHLLPAHQRSAYPDGYHNVGLAHGAAGVVGFLARCIERGCHVEVANGMLESAIAWLLHQRAPSTGRMGAWFPNVQERPDESRPLAWCYGDLGVAVALMRAASATGNADWRQIAVETARDCASRRGEVSAVVDTGLCHGTAGAALIFFRFWQSTGDVDFSDACVHWLLRTLSIRRSDLPATAGLFSSEGFGESQRAIPDWGLLSGAAGVGLAVLTCLGHGDDGWDAPLLTDRPAERSA
ncbi:MAG: lanthionine synthetase C family protein [Pseudomarimonas sp.]